MGHPGNWSARKGGRVQADNARRDREALRSATIEEHGETAWKLLEAHPCWTWRRGWSVYATCMGCLEQRVVNLEALQHSALAHAPWPRVMASLTCTACGSCAGALRFQRREGARIIDIGMLVARRAERT